MNEASQLTAAEAVAYARDGRPILVERLPDGSLRLHADAMDFPVRVCHDLTHVPTRLPTRPTTVRGVLPASPIRPAGVAFPRDRFGRLKRFR